MNFKRRLIGVLAAGLASLGLQADVVHVYEQTTAGGTQVVKDTLVNTGVKFTSMKAPAIEGYIFTHWTISTKQAFENRDPWGRGYNYVEFIPYEATILTANYIAASVDSDKDGVADGHEIHWYGDLTKNAASDTDGDGYTFAQELQYGMNPHFFDEEVKAGVVRELTARTLYNPNGYCRYVVRSEPEGELFETYEEWVRPGTTVKTITGDRLGTTFAYWTINGVRQCDEFYRAVNQASFVMPDWEMEVVAVCESEPAKRERMYWYGRTNVADDSDTDKDGYYFFEEIAMGSSPIFPDEHLKGVVNGFTEKMLYNPFSYQSYVVRSEPQGKLFETITEWVRPGTAVATKKFDHLKTAFAQWVKNGERQQDEFGRALSQVEFTMPSNSVELVAETQDDETNREKVYWYGNTSVSLASDTDGDGRTFADEIAGGTNPLFADESSKAGVVYAAGEAHEANLQPYEQLQGAIVGNKYRQLFTSPVAGNGATSETFANGGQIWPVVADVNGDGQWDLIVASTASTRVFVNVGSKGNPAFEEQTDVDLTKVDLQMNSTAKLNVLSLDIQPTDALSATLAGQKLLVSDTEGRIWYYLNGVLQHKVWGGSYAGFANGLMLAAVDWEDDGDLDCLAGTADGKLMLLRDPKVGRPTNVKALVGVDNVRLVWDPNEQSRIRGYRVYRGVADSEGNGVKIGETALPRYRDYPPEIADFDYRITSVSRFYTAGNSTPIVSESMPTEAVRASMGKVKFLWSDAAAFVDDEIAVKLGVENSLNLSGDGLAVVVSYDAAKLQPLRVETSGLTEGLALAQSAADGLWTVRAAGGEIAAGGGTFVRFVFRGLQAATDEVALVSATLKSVGGRSVTTVMPEKNARVEIWARQPETPTDPRYVGAYGKWDLDGDGWLTWEDRQLMARLMQGGPNKKYTAEQLRAGDDNGNGELDNHDFQQMKADFDELGIKNKEGTEVEVEQ